MTENRCTSMWRRGIALAGLVSVLSLWMTAASHIHTTTTQNSVRQECQRCILSVRVRLSLYPTSHCRFSVRLLRFSFSSNCSLLICPGSFLAPLVPPRPWPSFSFIPTPMCCRWLNFLLFYTKGRFTLRAWSISEEEDAMRRALSRVLISLILTLCPPFFDVAEADDSAEVRTLKKQVESLPAYG